MGQYNKQKESASLTLCQELFQYLSHPKTRPDISVDYTLCILIYKLIYKIIPAIHFE